MGQPMNEPGIKSEKIIRRRRDGSLEYQPDDLTIEEPLEIRVGGTTLATTMRTPGQDEELAAGFLLSEGVVRNRAELVRTCRPDHARNRDNIVCVELSNGPELPEGRWQRLGTITSSCGICGRETIDRMRQRFSAIPTADGIRVDVPTLLRLPDVLRERQGDFARTGGIHAAGLFDVHGSLTIAREDIGRHNAVDKVIGRALLDGLLPLHRSVLLVSGRASFEIVQKALAAGVPIIVSISAPSDLAVRFCRESNQTLVGFLRPPAFNVYSHIERVVLQQS